MAGRTVHMNLLIENARIVFPDAVSEPGWLTALDGRILDYGVGGYAANGSFETRIDAKGAYLAPGFIDLHVHGGGGADFRDADEDAFLTVLKTHIQGGTTTIFPTISSAGIEDMLASLECYNNVKAREAAFSSIPNLAGIHLEGPYFSYEQRGAQDDAFLHAPNPAEYRRILEASGHIRRWSIACELPGANELAVLLRSKGIVASIGHSNATIAQVREAVQNGFSCVTHVYSGCSIVHRNGPFREGGVVEGAFLLNDLDVEAIGDGVHLPPDFLKLVIQVKGRDRVALITDCIRAGGMDLPEGTEVFDDKEHRRRIYVESGVAIMPDRKNFAGSVASMSRVVRTAWKLAGVELADAVRMASLTPARMQGIDRITGSISRGKRADVVLFDENVAISAVIVRGRLCFQR